MSKRLWAIFSCLSLTGIGGTPARAADAQMKLSELRDLCSTSDPESAAACKFYILGAFEGLSMAGGAEMVNGHFVERTDKRLFCIPNDLPGSTMREKVLADANMDLRAFPADAELPAISFIGAVIARNYSCH